MSETKTFEESREEWLELLSNYIAGDGNNIDERSISDNIDGRVLEMISGVILTEFLQMGDMVSDFHTKRENGEIPSDQLLLIQASKVRELNIDLRPLIPFFLFNNIWKDNLRDVSEEMFEHNGKWYPIDIPVLMNNDIIITQLNGKKKEHKEGVYEPEEGGQVSVSTKNFIEDGETVSSKDFIFPQSLDMIVSNLNSIQRKKDVEDILNMETPTRPQYIPNHPDNLISQPYLNDLKRVLHMDFVSLSTENTLRCINELLDKMEVEKPHLSEEDLFYSNLLYNCLQSLFSYVDQMIDYYGEESVDIDFVCQFVHFNNMYLIITKVWKYGELEELTSFFGFAHPSFIKESIKYH